MFIGQVGVGKTTAICHLTGLTAKRQKRKKGRTGREVPVDVIEDLMATGSGFTTICEVVVRAAERTRIAVTPYELSEVERTISDFCTSIWQKVYPDAPDAGGASSEQQINFPPELVRAVRNMVKLPEGQRSDDDAAIHRARRFKRDQFEAFRQDVMDGARLDQRTVTELDCPDNDADPKRWIKDTFDDINLARLDSVSIPRRITLEVAPDLLSPQMKRVD
ncbi:MAG: hypothetical protein ACRELB_26450, partial [Polyangiaceae bacterium]